MKKKDMEKEIFDKIRKLKEILDDIDLPYFALAALVLGVSIQSRLLFYKLLCLKKIKVSKVPVPTKREVRVFFRKNPEVAEHFKCELKDFNKNYNLLKDIYLDLFYITDYRTLRRKYPELSEGILRTFSDKNLTELKRVIKDLSAELKKHHEIREIDAKDILKILKEIVKDIAKLIVSDSEIIEKILKRKRGVI